MGPALACQGGGCGMGDALVILMKFIVVRGLGLEGGALSFKRRHITGHIGVFGGKNPLCEFIKQLQS